jgi:tRNA pseudouridine32 synthase / 23S rRNA pseudouridine746 synthase
MKPGACAARVGWTTAHHDQAMSRPRAAWVPAMREGVSASRVAVGGGPWADVLDFLRRRLPLVADWPERLAQGQVMDAQGAALQVHAAAVPGAVIWYWRCPPPEPRVPFEVDVLYQDEHIVVADKPHFISVTPGGRHLHETVLVRLKRQLNISSLVPMHRLDSETAGVLLFTVDPQVRNAYHALMRGQQVHKVYEAVAPWRADLVLPRVHHSRLQTQDGDRFMQMLTVQGEPNAHTQIELIGRLMTRFGQLAHYKLTPFTGRKHQLRAQMSELGVPIVGDRIYPRLWPEPALGATPDYSLPLQLLARELAFTDPISGQARRFVSRRHLLLAGAAQNELPTTMESRV